MGAPGGAPLGLRIRLRSAASTQEIATGLARTGAAVGTTVIAGSQTEGRGRGGRAWASPPGGIYLSRLAAAPPSDRTWVPLAVGLGVREVAAGFGAPTWLRWPNDVVADGPGPGRKLAGVLVDAVAGPSGDRLVVGVGLNVAAPVEAFDEPIRSAAASLVALAGRPIDPRDVEGPLGDAIDRAVDALRTDAGRARVAREARAALFGVGRVARVDGARRGPIVGLGDAGTLVVATASGPEEIASGVVAVEGG